jgi:hypothetical protein
MTKRRYRFGQDYLFNTCKLGIAIHQGEKYYFLSDKYCRWLITDMDPATRKVEVRLWA